ncbi:MAG: hydroxypyruvate isomerase [Marinobacter sp.]|uniref:hydroxypyruvate isomerase n=1 Tax=Marinobacter sp. TaxID=50741 RepID=UPI00299E8F09|nr:hydroxypyruvate isomerase [Marinobacter sp.]MDX1635797.1 hydroxypyruvate isomerase [Marinobacter sp.]
MPRFAANLSMLFTEVEFEDRFERAAAAGFAGVEYLFPYPYPADTLRKLLDRHKLEQVLFNLPAGDWAAGERGIACLPERRTEFRDGVEQAIHYAEVLGCPRANCLAGIRPQELAPEAAWQTLVENVGWAAERFRRAGLTLCVEAINSRVDMPGFVLDSSLRAMDLLESVAADNVRFQYDLYHMQIMEGDLIRTLERLLPMIGHIQFADNPGRHEPGTGEINFDRVFEAIDRLGYPGWVSAEYHPAATTDAGLGWLAGHVARR